MNQFYSPWQQYIFAPQLPRITQWEGLINYIGPPWDVNPIPAAKAQFMVGNISLTQESRQENHEPPKIEEEISFMKFLK